MMEWFEGLEGFGMAQKGKALVWLMAIGSAAMLVIAVLTRDLHFLIISMLAGLFVHQEIAARKQDTQEIKP